MSYPLLELLYRPLCRPLQRPCTIRFSTNLFCSVNYLPKACSPGYSDTDRFRYLNSVSNHSRGWPEDKHNENGASVGILPGKGRLIKYLEITYSRRLLSTFHHEDEK